jgi:hypothetical protein
LRIESHQSVETETFQFDFNNLEVLLAATSSTTTITTTTVTTNTHLDVLIAKMKEMEGLGHDLKIEELSKTLTTFVQDYEAEQMAAATARVSVLARLAALEATAKECASQAELDATATQLKAEVATLFQRLQSASDAAAPNAFTPDALASVLNSIGTVE